MDLQDNQHITASGATTAFAPLQESENEAPGGADGEHGAETGAAVARPMPDRCRGNALVQLWRNIWGGERIALFLRVDPDSFCASPVALAVVALVDLLLNLAASFLLVGRGGFFSTSSIPGFFFHLPLLMFFGYWAGKLVSRSSLVSSIPVALISLSIPVELCHAALEKLAQEQQFKWLGDFLEAPHYYRFFWWWSVTSMLFLLRIKPASLSRRIATVFLFVVLVLTPLWFFPRADLWVSSSNGESGELHVTEQVLSAQATLLDGELAGLLPGRKEAPDLYFVGFAGDASQDVFLKELKGAERIFTERFGTRGRTVLLANNPKTGATLPFATNANLERALVRVGQVMNRNEDILFLFLTSHGSSEHQLSVNNYPLELEKLSPERVRQMLDKSGIPWRVVVVSACYSGGFIDSLKDDRTLIITAADATHESFGCGNGERYTWFGEAFIDKALPQTLSFTEGFNMARETIRKWEEEEGETPSNPQIWVGREIAPRLAKLEKELQKRQR